MDTAKLLALADHLESGKLNLVWNFSTFMALPDGDANLCGTCGCAIGEWSTIVGGRLGDMVREYAELGRTTNGAHIYEAIQNLVCEQFDISPDAFTFLFIPFTDGDGWLTSDAGPREVAHLIRWFVENDADVLNRDDEDLLQFEHNDYDRETINKPYA